MGLFSEVGPTLLEPEEGEGCFSDQMGSTSWLEQGYMGTWVFCPRGHPSWLRNKHSFALSHVLA